MEVIPCACCVWTFANRNNDSQGETLYQNKLSNSRLRDTSKGQHYPKQVGLPHYQSRSSAYRSFLPEGLTVTLGPGNYMHQIPTLPGFRAFYFSAKCIFFPQFMEIVQHVSISSMEQKWNFSLNFLQSRNKVNFL